MTRPPWPRLILVVVVTLFVGTALFLPAFNPLFALRNVQDAETAATLGQAWARTAQLRGELQQYVQREQHWPARYAEASPLPNEGAFEYDFPQAFVLRATAGRHFDPDSGLRGTRIELRYDPQRTQWTCSAGAPAPPRRWLPRDCWPPDAWTPREWLLLTLAASLGALLLLAAGVLLRSPLLTRTLREPETLLRAPLLALPGLDRALRRLRRRRHVLDAARIERADWDTAVRGATLPPQERAALIARRLSATCRDSDGWALPGCVHELALPLDLPVALERCLLYQPDPALSPGDTIRHLRGVQTGNDVLLVVSPHAGADLALGVYANDRANLCACLDQATQTELLLGAQPLDVLLRVLAQQLRVTRISPYQTRGGVARAASFFGREQLLARIVGREPANYLVVGGRQLGKTSLLKAVERRFVDHPRVRCHYVSLRDHRLAARLAADLGGGADAALDDVVARLKQRAQGRRLLLLVDEADLFLREDARRGYADLATLRGMSEEGLCHFILAGFWDLYQASALD